MKRGLIFLFFVSIISSNIFSGEQLRVAKFFNNEMILQRCAPIPIWGWGATPFKKVTVQLDEKLRVTTKAKEDGSWSVTLPEQQADNPVDNAAHIITVSSGKEKVSINDVLFGDVYLCSGQSNMELPISRCMDSVAPMVRNYNNRYVRYVKVPQAFNYVHVDEDIKPCEWQDITTDNYKRVSALCYFFARKLQETTNVPIGIINSSVGGTPVEAWTPRDVLSERTEYSREFEKEKYDNPRWVDSLRNAEYAAGYSWEKQLQLPRPNAAEYNRVDIFSDSWSKGNGLYWFKRTITLPKSVDGKPGVIRLGAIKDADSVFINGTYVGSTSYQFPPRIYNIPKGVLREGGNEILVRLVSEHEQPYLLLRSVMI